MGDGDGVPVDSVLTDAGSGDGVGQRPSELPPPPDSDPNGILYSRKGRASGETAVKIHYIAVKFIKCSLVVKK